MRAFGAAARHGGSPLQQNGKWLIFGKDSRLAWKTSPISTGRRSALLLCTARVSLAGRPGGARKSSFSEPSMPLAVSATPAGQNLIAALDGAVAAADALFADARGAVAARVTVAGRPMARVLDREQRAAHGLAWLATYVEAIRQLAAYAGRMIDSGNFGEIEERLVRIGAGEYLAQRLGGIAMSQGEIVRPADLGLSASAVAARITPAVDHLIATGNTAARRARLVELMRERPDATVGACGLDDTLDSIREEMRKFADGQVVPHAQA